MSTVVAEKVREALLRREERRAMIENARRHIYDGYVEEAVGELLDAVQLLHAEEERYLDLLRECHSMIECARKVMEAEVARRPSVVSVPNEVLNAALGAAAKHPLAKDADLRAIEGALRGVSPKGNSR